MSLVSVPTFVTMAERKSLTKGRVHVPAGFLSVQWRTDNLLCGYAVLSSIVPRGMLGKSSQKIWWWRGLEGVCGVPMVVVSLQ